MCDPLPARMNTIQEQLALAGKVSAPKNYEHQVRFVPNQNLSIGHANTDSHPCMVFIHDFDGRFEVCLGTHFSAQNLNALKRRYPNFPDNKQLIYVLHEDLRYVEGVLVPRQS